MIEIDIFKKVVNGKKDAGLKFNCMFPMGEITRLSGPSGAGKTSLLKMLAGFITPDQGMVKVDGDVWFDSNIGYSKKIQARRLGFVFQDYALFPKMTVQQHLEYGCKDVVDIDKLLSIGKLSELRQRFPKELSGGQQQRLSILRALATQPSIMLMDEPFSAIDFTLKKRLIEDLKAIFFSLNTTVIIVTHDNNELGNLGNDTIYLEQQL